MATELVLDPQEKNLNLIHYSTGGQQTTTIKVFRKRDPELSLILIPPILSCIIMTSLHILSSLGLSLASVILRRTWEMLRS